MREIRVEDDVFISDLYCIVLNDIGAAVISDLHLGFEEEMNLRGLFLPKLQFDHVSKVVDMILERYQPSYLIINGDFKHEFSKNLPQEWDDIKRFIELYRDQTKLTFVRGNHDNYLLSILDKAGLPLLTTFETDRYYIYHGDKDRSLKKLTILGHEHPSLVLRDRVGGVYKIPAFIHNPDSRVLVTPAVSFFSSGTDVTQSLLSEEHFTPVLKETDPSRFRVYGITEDFGVVDFGFIADLKRRDRDTGKLP
ncbi:metallophosphoesterase [Thermoplasmatales archaeon AK]|nr:metallophosphoesterase [Thermoplasmatales archaeon AK]